MKFNGKDVLVAMVKWEDCESLYDWQFEKDVQDYIARPLSVMLSVGWLLHDGDEWVILAQSIDQDQIDGFKAGDLMKIPKAMILDVKILDHDYMNSGRVTTWGPEYDDAMKLAPKAVINDDAAQRKPALFPEGIEDDGK